MARSDLLKSTVVVGAFTMLSRVAGFARDVVFATLFGAGAGMDAFLVAFKIPNFLRRLFAEGAFSQAFVPVLSEYKALKTADDVRLLVAVVSGTFGGFVVLLSLVAIVASPLLVMVFAPGFIGEAEKFEQTTRMLRITFPYLLFISLTAMAGGVLNTYGRFAVPAFTPVWLNVCLIGAAVWVAPQMAVTVEGLAWGVLVAGIVQLLFQFPGLMRLGLLPRPRWGWHHEGVRRILRLMLPTLFGSSVAQINLLFDTIIASFLVTGSVSWLYYSDRLMEFPLGVFGIAFATVLLPSLSRRHAEGDADAFSATLDWGIRWVLLLGLPAMIGLMILAGPMLATLFQYNAFQGSDVRMAQISLVAYGFGLPGFMLVKVLAPGFYARLDTKTPVRVGIYAIAVNMVLNVLFVVPWVFSGLPGPHAGLALATSIGACVNAGMLFYLLRVQGVYHAQAGWKGYLLRLLFANAVLAVVLLLLVDPLSEWLQRDMWQRIGWLALVVGVGVGAYLMALALVGLRPAQLYAKLPTSSGR